MIALFAVNHQFELGELLCHGQHLLLVDLFVATETVLLLSTAGSTSTGLLIIARLTAICRSLLILVEGILSETA